MMTSTATTSTTTTAATCSLMNRPTRLSSTGTAVSACNCNYNSSTNSRRKGRVVVSCGVAVKSSNSTTSVELDDKAASVSATLDEEEEAAKRVGSRIKVKVGLKVYHVPRVAEVDLTGMEGVVKQYVGVWKGKRISANLPYKVEFVTQVEGRGPVKFVAHLKEDEFDFLD